MTNFKYKFAVNTTNQQQKEITPELITLGYVEVSPSSDGEHYTWLINSIERVNGISVVCKGFPFDMNWKLNPYIIEPYNKDLVLAIAACVDDDVSHVEEYLIDDHGKVQPSDGSLVGINITDVDYYRKATLEEIVSHFGYEVKDRDIVLKGIHQFKVGDKVKIPKTRSAYRDEKLPKDSAIIRATIKSGRDYLFVKRVEDRIIVLSVNMEDTEDDHFLPSDLELYEEEPFPEKWCIKKSQEVIDWLNKNSTVHGCNNYTMNDTRLIIHYPDFHGTHHGGFVYDGYTLITQEQFNNHFKIKNIKEKKIVGYTLKKDCEKYLPALDAISKYFKAKSNYAFPVNSTYYKDYKQAGVLDLWFDAIYESTKVKMMFGKLEFELDLENKTAKADGKIIELEQFNKIMCKYTFRKLCGEYFCKIIGDADIKVCSHVGKLSEIKAIINKFNE